MFTVLGMPLLPVLGASAAPRAELAVVSLPYAEVIGDPIAQSKSPAIHSFWLGKLGLEAEYRAAHVRGEGLADYLAERPRRSGLARLQRDHAAQAGGHAAPRPARSAGRDDRRGEHDRAAKAATLIGSNTDAGGLPRTAAAAARAGRHLFRMARVLGTGGAARAIVAALAGQDVVIVLAGRDPAKARACSTNSIRRASIMSPPLAHFAEPTDFAFDDRAGCFDLIVNASPLGMAGQPPLAFDFSHVPPGSVIYDIVTRPLETPLLRGGARARVSARSTGLSMLIGQAAVAFEKFFGVAPPRDDGDARTAQRCSPR